MDTRTCRNKQHAKKEAAHALTALFQTYEKSEILFLVSGGSSLDLLDTIDIAGAADRITFSLVDERFVPEFDEESNYTALTNTSVYHNLLQEGASVIPTDFHDFAEVKNAAMWWERELHVWHDDHPDAVVIATMGVGSDGHTAGILPSDDVELFSKRFDSPEQWVVGYDSEQDIPTRNRVTLTYQYLRGEVDHAIVYAVGDEKKDALSRIYSGDGAYHETPAQILWEMKDAVLFTDQDVLRK